MTDPHPEKTTEIIIRTMKKTGVKIILLKGWAELGNNKLNDGLNDPNIKVIGSIFHHLFF